MLNLGDGRVIPQRLLDLPEFSGVKQKVVLRAAALQERSNAALHAKLELRDKEARRIPRY